MSRDWETCSTNHDNGVEDKAIHERQSSKLEAKIGQKLTELTLHKDMGWNLSNHKIVKYREINLNPSD